MLALSLIIFPDRALAFVPLEGQFTATDTCEALASIRKGTNPDNVKLQPGQTYQVVGKNKDAASHYLVEIDGASPYQRWVAVSCGTVASLPPEKNSPSPVAIGNKDYLLALSWQPAFCEIRPEKTECQTLAQNPDRPEATHFVLHGLWPQPRSNVYCNVSKSDINLDKARSWSKLPPVEEQLSPETWQKLQAVMPGTASNLHRHEWIKHGTCYSQTPEEYYQESIALLDAFNNSPVQAVMADSIGKQLAIQDIDEALSYFGSDIGDKVAVRCKNSVLGELWVNLEGDITLTTPVADLLRDAPSAKPEKFVSCLIDDARD